MKRTIIKKGDFMDNVNNTGSVHEQTVRGSGLLLTIGFISALLSLFRYSFFFGLLGIIMGILTAKNKSRAGLFLIVASIIFMGIGLIYGGVFYNYARHFLNI
jgi:hypothetical protein